MLRLRHLLVIPHTKPGLARQAIEKVYRVAGIKVAVALARLALSHPPAIGGNFRAREPCG